MDILSSCKDKLAYFRIKELKDVLTQLGLPKQGKKQDLVDRILSVLSDEQALKLHGWAKRHSIGKEAVAKIIEDTYRKMQSPGATDLASAGHSGSDINNGKLKEEVVDSFQMDMKVRCPCGNSLPTESMVQCEDHRCRVWQHISCVMIPEKPMEPTPPVPSQFYCEICRITRADPFWLTVTYPLQPVKLTISSMPTDGTNPLQNLDKSFQLTRADREMLQQSDVDVQAWCVLLNDKVPFRMQWPQYADLQVNGVPIRTTNRPGSQLLGANGRDDGPAITTCTREGINKISLTGCDARIFCFAVRIAKRRTVQQILNLIPKVADGERFEEALARVCRCVGGGNANDNADSDSDLEVVADSINVNLRCPMSGSRIKTAGRFKPCAHMGCFDLDTFVELNQRSRKWQCPICLKNYSLENVIIDPYFNLITTMMRGCGEDVTDIEVKPDGSWRAKNETERLDLIQWHLPNGAPCVEPKPNIEALKQVKAEGGGGSDGHTGLKIGIKKNPNGLWQVSRHENTQSLSSESPYEEKFQKIAPMMSSSATGSCREGEDPSVNQEGASLFDFSANNGHELDSVSLFGRPNRLPSSLSNVNSDVIVLSDSDDDDEAPTGQADFSFNPPGVSDSYPEDPGVSTSGGGLGLYPCNDDEMGIPLWSTLASGAQNGTGLQLFSTDPDVSNTVISEIPHNSLMNEFPLDPSSSNMNGSLVDNPLVFGGDDPALQIFLPSRPAQILAQPDTVDPDISNGVRSEDWISLRLGGGGSSANGGHDDSTGTNGINSRQDIASSKDGRGESLGDTASLLLSMTDSRSDKSTPSKRLGGPFSHPRQQRTVRPRLYLSIPSSDSE
ncbi:SUMO ligase siz1 [Ranunculus cassubicifolius]